MNHMRWAMVFLIAATSTASSESDVELASAVATAFAANRAKLTSWTIEFQFTVAKAKSLDDAIARRWSDESVARGYSAFDGVHGRYEIVHSLKDMVEKRVEVEPRHFQSHLFSRRALTDGEVTLHDHLSPNRTGTEMRHIVQIHPGADLFRQTIQLPLGLGKGELVQSGLLGHQVRLVQNRTGREMQVEEGVKLRGMDLVEFVFKGGNAKEDYTYWVDLEHGAIPRQTLTTYPTSEGGTSRDYMILDDLHDVGDGAWFPYRQLRYDERSKLVQERLITKADFTTPRAPSAFQLTFDKPVRVADNVRHVVYPLGTTWDLTRLPSAERSWGSPLPQGHDSAAKAAPPARYVLPPAMPGERPAQSKWRTIAIIALGVLALAGALTLQGRRRRDAST